MNKYLLPVALFGALALTACEEKKEADEKTPASTDMHQETPGEKEVPAVVTPAPPAPEEVHHPVETEPAAPLVAPPLSAPAPETVPDHRVDQGTPASDKPQH